MVFKTVKNQEIRSPVGSSIFLKTSWLEFIIFFKNSHDEKNHENNDYSMVKMANNIKNKRNNNKRQTLLYRVIQHHIASPKPYAHHPPRASSC
jgi:hypothetical protein